MALRQLRREYADLPEVKILLEEHQELNSRAAVLVREKRREELAAKFKEWGTLLEEGHITRAEEDIVTWCETCDQMDCRLDGLIAAFIPFCP